MTTSLPKNKNIKTVKFMQTLNLRQWLDLSILAEDKGITVQEYIRIFAVNEYLKGLPSPPKRYSLRAKKSWETRRKNAEDAEIQAKKDAFPQ